MEIDLVVFGMNIVLVASSAIAFVLLFLITTYLISDQVQSCTYIYLWFKQSFTHIRLVNAALIHVFLIRFLISKINLDILRSTKTGISIIRILEFGKMLVI